MGLGPRVDGDDASIPASGVWFAYGLREPLALVRRRDARLARQGTDAVNSVALNLAEGAGREGGDQAYHWRIALGSLREVGAVLDIAAALGWIAAPALAAERDRLAGMIRALSRR